MLSSFSRPHAHFVPRGFGLRVERISSQTLQIKSIPIYFLRKLGWRRSEIFYRMREFIGSQRAIVRVCRGARGRGFLHEQVARNNVRKRFGHFCYEGVGRLSSATSDGAKLASLPNPRAIYSISQRSASILSPPRVIFGQPGLKQTQKTKSVVHM